MKAGWLVVFGVFPVYPVHPLFLLFWTASQPANQPSGQTHCSAADVKAGCTRQPKQNSQPSQIVLHPLNPMDNTATVLGHLLLDHLHESCDGTPDTVALIDALFRALDPAAADALHSEA